MQHALRPSIQAQIDTARDKIRGDRPLIICDADEVLLRFVETLELFLAEKELYLRLDSFALSGNIRRLHDDSVVSKPDIAPILQEFFVERVSECPPVEHAVDALGHLAEMADILVLTNLPSELRHKREEALAKWGMPYPVIANDGLKGAAVKSIINDHIHFAAFLDDLPPNLESVSKTAPDVHLIHFVADVRLQPLLGTAPQAHKRIDCWLEARDYLEAKIHDSRVLP